MPWATGVAKAYVSLIRPIEVPMRTPARGFTLIELLVVIAVLGISLAAAYPSFRTAIQNNRLTTQANEITTMVTLARSEAVRASLPVSVCGGTESACTGNWGDGLLVSYGSNDGDDAVAADQVIQYLQGPQFAATFAAAPAVIQFSPAGFLANGPVGDFSLSIADCKGQQVRTFSITFAGRIRAVKSGCP
jgi:type IV fimbrial biogenesis protein FimT